MDDMEQKLNAVLNNPEMMGKILSMAQSLGGSQEQPASAESAFDPKLLNQLAGMARKSGVDPQQQNLLKALEPYLTDQRLRKLERAMRAAKMARMASTVLGTTNLFAGR
jgi:hypothetical protein